MNNEDYNQNNESEQRRVFREYLNAFPEGQKIQFISYLAYLPVVTFESYVTTVAATWEFSPAIIRAEFIDFLMTELVKLKEAKTFHTSYDSSEDPNLGEDVEIPFEGFNEEDLKFLSSMKIKMDA